MGLFGNAHAVDPASAHREYARLLGQGEQVHAAYLLIPGMSRFRAPTRFMVVVELGLVLLAAIGLTRVGAELTERWKGAARVPRLIQIAVPPVPKRPVLVRLNPFLMDACAPCASSCRRGLFRRRRRRH